MYIAHAWSVPLLVAVLLLAFPLSPQALPDTHCNPSVAEVTDCCSTGALQKLIYCYGILIALPITNVSLFAFTAYDLRQSQRDSRKRGEADGKRYSWYLVLFLLMGITWAIEFISFIIDWQFGKVPASVWYITNLCDESFGVLLILASCFNKKTWNMLKGSCRWGNIPEKSGLYIQDGIPESKPIES